MRTTSLFRLSFSTHSISRIAITLVVLIAGLDLVGWALDIGLLKGIVPYSTPMRVITALCFLISAAVLACSQGEVLSRRKVILAYTSGIAISAVGLLTLMCWLINLKTGHEWSSAM
ncbi:MAG TPA: hypothetical protein VE398_13525, partial [Acidobacteriota bacterium]|nr:hypothetical protein [Acidobacteriota bacterium]